MSWVGIEGMIRQPVRRIRLGEIMWTGAIASVLLTALFLYGKSDGLDRSFDPRAFVCSTGGDGVQSSGLARNEP